MGVLLIICFVFSARTPQHRRPPFCAGVDSSSPPNPPLFRHFRASRNPGIARYETLTAANDILYNAVCGISEVITKRGEINLDFNDVRSVMSKKGKAVIGSSRCSGKNRAEEATEQALCCPLMEDVDLTHASGVLTNVTCSRANMKLAEINLMQDCIKQHIPECDESQFCGVVYDDSMCDDLRVTIIVTGINAVGSGTGEPSLEVVKGEVTDNAFTSGRERHRKNEALEKFGGVEEKVPAILRRQVS